MFVNLSEAPAAAPGTPTAAAAVEKAKKSHTKKPLPPGGVEEPKPRVPCPHCGKEYERLHFHKCKKAPTTDGAVATAAAAKPKAAKAPAAGTAPMHTYTYVHIECCCV
jgi:hypothetical protein